jgi:hypothetical protein
MMNRIKYIAVTGFAFVTLVAGAQGTSSNAAPDYPKFEVPIGFSFVNVHPNQALLTSFNVFGGGGGFVYNVTPLIGIKADFMGYTQGTGQKVSENGQFVGNVSGNLFTYMFGPQLKMHKGKFQPFGEALFGAAHTNLDANLCEVVGDCASGTGSNNGFAMEFGAVLTFQSRSPFNSARSKSTICTPTLAPITLPALRRARTTSNMSSALISHSEASSPTAKCLVTGSGWPNNYHDLLHELAGGVLGWPITNDSRKKIALAYSTFRSTVD